MLMHLTLIRCCLMLRQKRDLHLRCFYVHDHKCKEIRIRCGFDLSEWTHIAEHCYPKTHTPLHIHTHTHRLQMCKVTEVVVENMWLADESAQEPT